ncbi:UDP-N-acetyl-D-mannosaminuronic acid dehydrogenase [Serinicoccus hydrothermalis]|uniref:UDP-N-acetyl-D-mannosaminuronic acid dehydrogenase n=1 Tax=Serinicoccus hydrothermalis TaxID=1758689 RepID=A0A1B1N957_9MICO|nr:nucleotide sugar dehydrogenase [Serinicoccus hydrothermalis]ANS77934.1 UDP-N-acetyl-D-mannosaminuronic acid dehydrogenase [Serinicoccus hydrothermalis]
MKIAVVAMGKIGLPLAVQFADADPSHEVVGIDVNAQTVATINEGHEPFPGEAHLADKLAELVPAGRLRATTDYAEGVPGADAVIVVVPLFVDEVTGAPDFGWMDAATQSLAQHLTPGTLVSYETTLPVGTTRGRWKPMIEEISGLREGGDHGFHLVFSPERVLTGRVLADLRRYPKLVGGLTVEGTRRAVAYYEAVLDFDRRDDLPRPNGVWDMGSAEAAEMAKLAETTYRDVNIGLANQFARFADSVGIDVHRVIAACNSQPYSHIHQPGIAVGGHCIPVYPRLYLSTDAEATVVRTAREANAAMPEYAVARAESLLGRLEGLRVLVLGASYRGRVKETAFSGVFATVEALRTRGAQVLVHDPMYTAQELSAYGWEPYAWAPGEPGEPVDVAIVQADHPEYATLSAADLPGLRLLLDGRRVTDPDRFTGVPRLTIGGGEPVTA